MKPMALYSAVFDKFTKPQQPNSSVDKLLMSWTCSTSQGDGGKAGESFGVEAAVFFISHVSASTFETATQFFPLWLKKFVL